MEDSQRDEDPDIQAFLKWRQSEGQKTLGTKSIESETCPMISTTALKNYLRSDKVKKLLKVLFSEGDFPAADYVVDHYLRPFAILLCMNLGHFITRFVEYDQLRDEKLPFESRPPNFPEHTKSDIWKDFYSQQWEFCPVTLRFNMEQNLGEHEILPFATKEKVGEGGTSSVYKVTAHQECNELRSVINGFVKHCSNAEPVTD